MSKHSLSKVYKYANKYAFEVSCHQCKTYFLVNWILKII